MNVQINQQQPPVPLRAAAESAEGAARVAGGAAAVDAVAQRANAGPHASSLAQLRTVVAQRACADCETVERTMGGGAPVQRAEDEGGLPAELRAGLESLSGRDLSDVRVNYNSPRPGRLNAHAVAQGRTIDVAPGQERHLPHEGWHAVQQMQNRVRPTMSLGGTPVNDDAALEREADVMGARAMAAGGAAQLRAVRGASPSSAGGGGVAQRAWNYDADADLYESDNAVDGRIWEWRLVRPEREAREGGDEERRGEEEVEEPRSSLVEQYRWRLAGDDDGWSDWDAADTFVEAGNPPPMGALFAEQRRRDAGVAMGPGSHRKYAYVAGEGDAPLAVQNARDLLGRGLQAIRARVKEEKAMLDAVIQEEFGRINAGAEEVRADPGSDPLLLRELFSAETRQKISVAGTLNEDQMEELRAGLRYKRVYEHEQNLLTINRRSGPEYELLVQSVENESGLALIRQVEEGEGGRVESLFAQVEDHQYPVGTFYFGDTRFQQSPEQPDGARNLTFQHRENGREFVKDGYGRFVPRFVRRAVRYEDVLSLRNGGGMESKMKIDDAATGKEAADYNRRDLAGQQLDHRQKVMGQIRGYSRFLSATSSNRLATSTSRGTYASPFGEVGVDLARVPGEDVTDAHSEAALQDIFSVGDLGRLEFIPKHLTGETSEAKAARDGYRAREVVIAPPPVDAIAKEPRPNADRGIIVIGLTNKATEANLRALIPEELRAEITFMEVNTRYQRTVEGKKGRSAFIFFRHGTEIEPAIEALKRGGAGLGPEPFVFDAPVGFQAPE